ncbi:MAG: glycine dehydrogenase, partial [Acidobacteria bacterium]|nr:glycine dehydrogenase [Acidobacteriota bacterium]
MRYLPKSPEERRQMLAEIGCNAVEQLFAGIPSEVRLGRGLKLEPGQSEPEIIRCFEQWAAENARGFTSFLGAGAYDHFIPVFIDQLISRGEFLTGYTPYQAEASQGTLQAFFEFQTQIARLTGMDFANSSLYEGATAVVEAALLALNTTGKRRVLVSRALHPDYRKVLQ